MKSSKQKSNSERPQKLRTRYSRDPDELTISYPWRAFGTGLFGIFFLSVWSVACVFLLFRVLEKPELMRVIVGSVFWIAWIFVFLFTVSSIFGCDYVKVDRDSLTYVNRIFIQISRRQCPFSEVKQISIKNRKQNEENTSFVPGMVIETLGGPISVFSGVSMKELLWLKSELVDAIGLDRRIEVSDEAVILKGNSFESALSIVEKPSESTWQMRQDFDGLVFFQRGTFSLLGIFVILMLNVFWNGIVSVFVMNLLGFDDDPPRGLDWIGRALFLIPFVLIGLLFVFLFLLTLIEPLRVTSWTFTSNSIDCAWRWLGLGPRWHYDVTSLQSISIDKSKRRKAQQESDEVEDSGPLRYCITFHANESSEICTFDSLTEGEARWIAENVRRVLPLR